MMRPLLLLLGLLFVTCPMRASFWSAPTAEAGSLVLAISTSLGSDVATIPPITIQGSQLGTCISGSPMWVATNPELSYFQVDVPASSLASYSFGCQPQCTGCSFTGVANISVEAAAISLGTSFLKIYSVAPQRDTLTTFIYTDHVCSAFVWPSTPVISTNGECLKSKYFNEELKSTYYQVQLLESSLYSIVAHCADPRCQDCHYGNVGALFPSGMDSCTNIVVNNSTFYVQAKLGGIRPWSKGRVVTVAIGVGAAAVLLLASVAVIIRSMRPGYNRIA